MLENASTGDLVIERLLHRESFPHDVDQIRLLETHISWVILTGPFAYKIKKPVTFEFVDYSTLKLRKEFCEKELELNRRLAPDLYLDVVPIYETNGQLSVASQSSNQSNRQSGKQIEYAVKMRQFPQESIVASRLDHPELTANAVELFGNDVAKFHLAIESAIPTLDCVQAARIRMDALENFPILSGGFGNDRRSQTLAELKNWTIDQYRLIGNVFERRLRNGLVRRCHGDMHLKNIIQLDGQMIAFDGIEFNEEFQWIDVMSELAFPVMDFIARGRADLGWRLLNAYLEATGDYQGLSVLRFYLVYRAMVRAKVTWLNPTNRTPDAREDDANNLSSQIDELAGPWDKYLKAAKYFAFGLKPILAITHGFSGSGKSSVALQIIEQTGGIRIRTDVERHRLAEKFKTRNKYTRDMSDWVYGYVLEQARAAIESGWPVIADATFLKRHRRVPFEQLARELGIEFQIVDCDAPFEELCNRIRNRGPDPSQATIDVLRTQMATHDPLTTDELQYVRQGGP